MGSLLEFVVLWENKAKNQVADCWGSLYVEGGIISPVWERPRPSVQVGYIWLTRWISLLSLILALYPETSLAVFVDNRYCFIFVFTEFEWKEFVGDCVCSGYIECVTWNIYWNKRGLRDVCNSYRFCKSSGGYKQKEWDVFNALLDSCFKYHLYI